MATKNVAKNVGKMKTKNGTKWQQKMLLKKM